MSRYFFDVHNIGPAEWDDDGLECADRSEVEARVRQVAQANADRHDGGRAPVTISVLNDNQEIVLMALVDANKALKLVWDRKE